MLAKKKNDDGFSLAEVIIALVILVVAGGILLNGLVSNQNLNTKVNAQSLRLSSLLTGAETITAAPFTGCKKDSPDLPYSDLALPTNVSIEKVEWFSPTKVWEPCSKKPDTAPSIQRVILKYQSGAVIMRRTVLKVFGADPLAYTAGYSVKIVNPATNTGLSAVKREMGPTDPSRDDAMTATLSLTATANTSTTCYSILPAYKLAVEAYVDSPDGTGCGSSTTLNVKNLKTTNSDGTVTYAPPGTYALDIAGFDPVSGGIAYPATLVVRVRPSLQLDFQWQYYTNTWVDPTASTTTCASFATKRCRIRVSPFPGTGSFNYSANKEYGLGIAVTSPTGANITVTITPAAVSGAYFPDATTGVVDVQIQKNNTSTNGLVCNTGGPTSFTFTVRVSDYGIPSATTDYSVPVTC